MVPQKSEHLAFSLLQQNKKTQLNKNSLLASSVELIKAKENQLYCLVLEITPSLCQRLLASGVSTPGLRKYRLSGHFHSDMCKESFLRGQFTDHNERRISREAVNEMAPKRGL